MKTIETLVRDYLDRENAIKNYKNIASTEVINSNGTRASRKSLVGINN
jgi:hypothetical protein